MSEFAGGGREALTVDLWGEYFFSLCVCLPVALCLCNYFPLLIFIPERSVDVKNEEASL